MMAGDLECLARRETDKISSRVGGGENAFNLPFQAKLVRSEDQCF